MTWQGEADALHNLVKHTAGLTAYDLSVMQRMVDVAKMALSPTPPDTESVYGPPRPQRWSDLYSWDTWKPMFGR